MSSSKAAILRGISEIIVSESRFKLRLLALISFLAAPVVSVTSPGSSEHLKALFIGRCWTLQTLDAKSAQNDSHVDCQALWHAFETAVAYKHSCQVNESNYDSYFAMIIHGTQPLRDKALFWSGTKIIAHQLSSFNCRYRTLEDTLPGYVLDGLNFCGSLNGFANSSCPARSKCPKTHALTNYWLRASEQFAKRAQGITYVLVNGSRTDLPAYSRESVFGGRELPNLNISLVTELRVLVVSDIAERKRETCHTKTIKLLVEDARKRGIQTTCIEDPAAVLNILCLRYPHADECSNCRPRTADETATYVSIALALVCCLLACIIAFLGIKLWKVRNSPEDKHCVVNHMVA